MSPVVIDTAPPVSKNETEKRKAGSAVFHRNLSLEFPSLVKAEGIYLYLEDGRKILDASGGAAVACLGFGNERVVQAVSKQVLAAPYCATIFYTTQVCEGLCRTLVDSTNGVMSRAFIVSSGQCQDTSPEACLGPLKV